ncbi:PAS domain-containing sensor histidine kinase [Solitalea canadensis]|uniref:histidine kinase n=1 Tax=Solitalea canadensis (strain ATCC 29591 / DSM 3403 / JCM 21819 / LMG 8368 / NBRC 15130 / NCIMB 12057 / USAM 9D) TaxID=929556 RepID=H8KQD2_SOLCM|nr:PAS domain-containing sensor histidine kinase [Solitalea canadensis]AFD06548.1 PAS domain S-box [Solitalea canadensis DSM 3403]
MKIENNLYSTRNENRQFEALFDFAAIGIVLINETGEIINFNRQAELQFGYKKEEVIGCPVELLIPIKFHQNHSKFRDDFYKNPQNRPMGSGRDLYAQRKDGNEFPVEVSLSYYNTNGDMNVVAFIIDITVRKGNEAIVLKQKEELESFNDRIQQMNSELEQKIEDRTKMLKETLAELEKSKNEVSDALEREKELSDLKSRFVTMASHEFRTPLSTILSSASLIEHYNESDESEKRLKHIQRIKSGVTALKSILEDFLSLGKLEEGSVQAKPELVDAEFLIIEMESVIQDMQQLVKLGQTIVYSCNLTGKVFIDCSLFKNIAVNLISNSIKFSSENSVIEVACSNTSQYFIFKVKDNGIGISEEDQKHLFERFFRAKNAINVQGTGLGLHIIAKYLEMMNGSIEIKSELNKGSDFTVKIPQVNHE